MPRVPTRQEPGVQVRPLRGGRLSPTTPPGTFGEDGTIARSGREFAQDVGQVAIQEQQLREQAEIKRQEFVDKQRQEANQILTQELGLELSKAQTIAEVNAKRLRGRDAIDAPSTARKEFNKSISELRKRTNSDIEADFEQMVLKADAQMQNTLTVYSANEIQKHDLETYSSQKQVLQDSAALNYNEPDRIARTLIDQRNLINLQAQRQGWDKATRDKEMSEAVSNTHVNVLTRMLVDEQFELANQYVEANKDDIDETDLKIVDRVRREAEQKSKVNKTQQKESIWRGLSNGTMNRPEVESAFQLGQIDFTTRNKMINYLVDGFNSPAISGEERNDKMQELIDGLVEAGIAERDDNGQLNQVNDEESLAIVEKNREKLHESKGYLTKAQFDKFDQLYASSVHRMKADPKSSIFKSMYEAIKQVAELNPLNMTAVINRGLEDALDIFSPGVTVEQAQEKAEEIKKDIAGRGNPNAVTYKVGDRIRVGSQDYEVTGFDKTDGEPLVELVK